MMRNLAISLLISLSLVSCGGGGGSSSGGGGGSTPPPPPPPAGDMTVTAGNLDASGDQGGPFSPSQMVYTLTNTGGTSLDWTASKSAGWVSLNNTSGTLAASANTTVTVSINANANSLAAGNHNDTVVFTNVTASASTPRDVNLTVNAGAGTGGSGGTAGTFSQNTTVNGIARSYRLYVPASAITAQNSGPVTLVFGFHGVGDTGANFIAAIGMTSSASSNSFILVGPDAYPGNGGARAWFLQPSEGWPGADGNSSSTNNDLLFINQIINEVGGSYDVHTKKIHAFGFSRGAGMTVLVATGSNNSQFLSGTWSSPFASYGVCAGYDPFGGGLNFNNSSPKRPIWFIHGTNDSAVPYSWGQGIHNALVAAGWPSSFTTVSGAPHNWLWASIYGHSNQELVDFFTANPLP